jgi:heme exporter protein B
MTGLRTAMVVARRDLAVELSGRHLSRAVVPFAVAGVLLSGLAFGPEPAVLDAVGAGLPWLVVLLLAAPLSSSVAEVEQREGCWDLLRGLAGPAALLGGKLSVTWLWLLTTWTVTAVLAIVVLDVQLALAAWPAALLGTLGLATAVVVYGTAAASSGGGGGAMLAALIVPAGLPALLAGTQAALLDVDPGPWLAVLVAYDAVGVAVAWAVFPTVLEE